MNMERKIKKKMERDGRKRKWIGRKGLIREMDVM